MIYPNAEEVVARTFANPHAYFLKVVCRPHDLEVTYLVLMDRITLPEASEMLGLGRTGARLRIERLLRHLHKATQKGHLNLAFPQGPLRERVRDVNYRVYMTQMVRAVIDHLEAKRKQPTA